jgi:hypothetical protein
VTYLEKRDASGARRILLPKHQTVQWVIGTGLVVIDGKTMLHVDTGKTVELDSSHELPGYAVVDRRLYVTEAPELVVYDLDLAVVARWRPRLALFTDATRTKAVLVDEHLPYRDAEGLVPVSWARPMLLGPGSLDIARDVVRDGNRGFDVAVRKTADKLHVTRRFADRPDEVSEHDLAGPARWIEGSTLVIGDDWIYSARSNRTMPREPGPVEVALGPEYVRYSAGELYEIQSSLVAAPRGPGHLVVGNRHGLVFADEDDFRVWHVSLDGTWRRYSFRQCELPPRS